MAEELDRVVSIVREIGRMGALAPDEDLYDAGFSSVNALQLLVELESAFDVTIPDDEFISARTPRRLSNLVTRLQQEAKP